MRPPSDIVPPSDPPARHTGRPLPPYRHVPGLHPHPVANPQGHSYHPEGQHPPAGPLLPPERWREMEDYLYGVDLYNQGYWWEAHEAWEGLWQQADKSGQQGRFLQGLIQVSAAHLKRHVNEPEGVQRLLARALQHLEAVAAPLRPGDLYMGLDIGTFIGQVKEWFGGLSSRFPSLILR